MINTEKKKEDKKNPAEEFAKGVLLGATFGLPGALWRKFSTTRKSLRNPERRREYQEHAIDAHEAAQVMGERKITKGMKPISDYYKRVEQMSNE